MNNAYQQLIEQIERYSNEPDNPSSAKRLRKLLSVLVASKESFCTGLIKTLAENGFGDYSCTEFTDINGEQFTALINNSVLNKEKVREFLKRFSAKCIVDSRFTNLERGLVYIGEGGQETLVDLMEFNELTNGALVTYSGEIKEVLNKYSEAVIAYNMNKVIDKSNINISNIEKIKKMEKRDK